MIAERKTCRVCDGELVRGLDLGVQYVSDFPATPDAALGIPGILPNAPLVLGRCRRCHLVQLTCTVPREMLYGQYWYRSGTNEVMRGALLDVVGSACEIFTAWQGRPLGERDTVIDIGANDGTLLSFYRLPTDSNKVLTRLAALGVDNIVIASPGPQRIAFDPAQNLHSDLAQHCELLVPDYFPARRYEGPKAKIVTAIAMMYDLEDPQGFVEEVARVLDKDGVFVVQVGDLRSMVESTGFDAICHEHLEYYTYNNLRHLLWLHRLRIFHAQANSVNGGSLRIYACHDGAAYRPQRSIQALELQEAQLGYNTPVPLEQFEVRVALLRTKLRRWMIEMHEAGKRVDVYGASTKGNTTLQFLRFDSRFIHQAVDRSPAKWGRYTVGTRIPIVSEEHWRGGNASDHALVLIWQFRGQVIEREIEYLKAGGKFIFPMPMPEIVSGTPDSGDVVGDAL